MDSNAVELLESINDSEESEAVKDLMAKIVHRVEDGKTRHGEVDLDSLHYSCALSAQDAGIILAVVEAFGQVFDVPEEVKLASLRLNYSLVDGAVFTLDNGVG